MSKLKKWEFYGDVLSFGKVVQRGWHARTVAPTERKAYSNMCHQYKTNNNMYVGTNLTLEGDLTEIE